MFYFGGCGRLVTGIVAVIPWNVGLRERKVTFVIQHERRPAVVLCHPPVLRFHGRSLLVRVLRGPSLLPTDDVPHLEGSVNQGMGAMIFSVGVTQTRSVPSTLPSSSSSLSSPNGRYRPSAPRSGMPGSSKLYSRTRFRFESGLP